MKRVGLFLGKFLPLHAGHVGALLDAYAASDHLVVVVDENSVLHRELWPLGRYPDGATRLKWVQSLFEGLPHVSIYLLGDNNYYSDHDGDMSGFARDILSKEVDYCGKAAPDVIFFSELHYKSVWHHMYPDAELVVQDAKREGFDISGSQVRRSPYRHWAHIAYQARPSVALRVRVVGAQAPLYEELLSRCYGAPLWKGGTPAPMPAELLGPVVICSGADEHWTLAPEPDAAQGSAPVAPARAVSVTPATAADPRTQARSASDTGTPVTGAQEVDILLSSERPFLELCRVINRALA